MEPNTNVHSESNDREGSRAPSLQEKLATLRAHWSPRTAFWCEQDRRGRTIFRSDEDAFDCKSTIQSGLSLFNYFAQDLEKTDSTLISALCIFKKKLYALGRAYDNGTGGKVAYATFAAWWKVSHYKRFDRARAGRYQSTDEYREYKRGYDQSVRGKELRAARKDDTNAHQRRRDRARRLLTLLGQNTPASMAEYEEKRLVYEKEYGPDKRFPPLAEEFDQAAE